MLLLVEMEAIKPILEEERETSDLNALRLKSAYDFRRRYLINSKGDLFLTVDSLMRLNNIITGAHNIHLRTHNIRPAGYHCVHYMTFDKIEAAFYCLVDDFIDRRILHRICSNFPRSDTDGTTAYRTSFFVYSTNSDMY